MQGGWVSPLFNTPGLTILAFVSLICSGGGVAIQRECLCNMFVGLLEMHHPGQCILYLLWFGGRIWQLLVSLCLLDPQCLKSSAASCNPFGRSNYCSHLSWHGDKNSYSEGLHSSSDTSLPSQDLFKTTEWQIERKSLTTATSYIAHHVPENLN